MLERISGANPGAGVLPVLNGASGAAAEAATLTHRTRLSPLENTSVDVKRLIVGFLGKAEREALEGTSRTMRAFIKGESAPLTAQVDALLAIPHAERTLEHMVRIRLLPRSVLLKSVSPAKKAVLTADNIVIGLKRNVENGVKVNMRAFDHVPSDRMPKVENGIAMLDDEQSSRRISSQENRQSITLRNGSKTTILTEMVKSNVFANALCSDEQSLFQSCLDNFRSQCTNNSRTLKALHLDLMKQWANVLHPDIHRVQPRTLPSGICEGRMGYVGFSSRFEAAITHRDIVEIMLAQRVNFDAPKVDGKTPLICAAMGGHRHMAEIMSVLLAHGVKVNHADRWGMTALHWAAKTGHPGRVALLLQHGANINHLDVEGRNILHNLFATTRWHGADGADLARILVRQVLDAGVDLLQKDRLQLRPIDYIREAVRYGAVPRSVAQMVERAMRAQRREQRRAERGCCVIA